MGTEGEIFRTDLSTIYRPQHRAEQPFFQEKSPEMIVEEHMKKIGELATEAVISAFDYGFFKEILESYTVLESGLIHFDINDETKATIGLYVGTHVLTDVATFIQIYSVNRKTQLERDLQSVPANGNSLVTGGNGTIDETTQTVLNMIRQKLENGTPFEKLTKSQQSVWIKHSTNET